MVISRYWLYWKFHCCLFCQIPNNKLEYSNKRKWFRSLFLRSFQSKYFRYRNSFWDWHYMTKFSEFSFFVLLNMTLMLNHYFGCVFHTYQRWQTDIWSSFFLLNCIVSRTTVKRNRKEEQHRITYNDFKAIRMIIPAMHKTKINHHCQSIAMESNCADCPTNKIRKK